MASLLTAGMWDSTDLPVPLLELVEMFDLTEDELRTEAVSGRLVGQGIRTATGYDRIEFLESSIRSWLRSDLPTAVRAKADAAGALDRLEGWRREYFSKINWDFIGNSAILPDGTRIVGIKVDAESVKRSFPPKRRN